MADRKKSEAEIEAEMLAQMESAGEAEAPVAEDPKAMGVSGKKSEAEIEAEMLAQMEPATVAEQNVVEEDNGTGSVPPIVQDDKKHMSIKPKFMIPIAAVIIVSQAFLAFSILSTAKEKQEDQANVFIRQLEKQKEVQTNNIRNDLENKASLIMELLKKPASILLYNYDIEVLGELAKSVSKDKDVIGISFTDENGDMVFENSSITKEEASHKMMLNAEGDHVGELLIKIDYSSIDVAVKQISESIAQGVLEGQETTRSAVSELLNNITIYTLIGMGVLMLITWLCLSKLIANPIIFAKSFASKIMNGDLNEQKIPFNSKDEIGLLLKDLDGMRVSLNDWIHNLDDKVEEKTEEVTRAMSRIEKGMKELEGEGMTGIFTSLEATTSYIGSEITKIQDKIFSIQDQSSAIKEQLPEGVQAEFDEICENVNDTIALTMMGDLSAQKLDNILRQLKELKNYILALLGEEGEDLSGINYDSRIDKVGVEEDDLDIDALLEQYGSLYGEQPGVVEK